MSFGYTLVCAECNRNLHSDILNIFKEGTIGHDTIDSVFYGKSFHRNDGKPLLYSLMEAESEYITEDNQICDEALDLLDGSPESEGIWRPFIQDQLNRVVEARQIYEEVINLLDTGAVPASDYGYSLYFCPECKSLHNRFYFKLLISSKVYEPDYLCPKCKIKMHPLVLESVKNENRNIYQAVCKNDKTVFWHCPVCNGTKVKQEILIHYD